MDPYAKLLSMFRQPKAAAGPVFGRVDRWPSADAPNAAPAVTVEGLPRDRDALLRDGRFGAYDFAAGDLLLMVPTDDRQRYVILCKVVEV